MKKEHFSLDLGDGLPHKEFVLDINTELKVKLKIKEAKY